LGARTSTIEKLWFDPETVTKRISWNFPGRAILYDLDGSTTGKGPNSWATPYFKHNEQDGCTRDDETSNIPSLFCDNRVEVRKLYFSSFSPNHRFKLQPMRILRFDDDLIMSVNKEEYVGDKENYTSYPWLKSGWTVPFVTGHKYKISWGNNGLDWDKMKVTLSERWTENDQSIYFVHNFTDVREAFDVKVNSMKIDDPPYLNDTILFPKDYQLGNNVIFPTNDVREFHFIVNGKQAVEGKFTETQKMEFTAHRCKPTAEEPDKCNDATEPGQPCPEDLRYWSEPKDWDEEKDPELRKAQVQPMAGDSFKIPPGWNMILDLAETPIFDTIEVNGCLGFKNGKDGEDITLKAKKILIRGELYIGSKEEPFKNNARIELYGGRNEPTIKIDDTGGIEGGSKIIANLSRLKMYGKQRSFKMTRLT
jgi:hypothetical protein